MSIGLDRVAVTAGHSILYQCTFLTGIGKKQVTAYCTDLPWQQAMAYCADWPYFSWLCRPSYCRVLHVIVAWVQTVGYWTSTCKYYNTVKLINQSLAFVERNFTMILLKILLPQPFFPCKFSHSTAWIMQLRCIKQFMLFSFNLQLSPHYFPHFYNLPRQISRICPIKDWTHGTYALLSITATGNYSFH
jgi:hypothetical protein